MDSGEYWWNEIGETGEPREKLKNPEVSLDNFPLATPRFELGTHKDLTGLLVCPGTALYYITYNVTFTLYLLLKLCA